MNSCILMAEIVQEPQLRYTPDQLAIAEMLVQFPGLRAEDPPATLKVVGWGNTAQEIQQHYHQGDRIVIEGRLTMNTVERPEGFKEKRAELTVQKIHPLGDGVSISSSATVSAAANNSTTGKDKVEERATVAVGVPPQSAPAAPMPQSASPQVPNYPVSTTDSDVDDIPF